MKYLSLFFTRLTYPLRLLLAILVSAKILKEYMTYCRSAMWYDMTQINELGKGLKIVIGLLEMSLE